MAGLFHAASMFTVLHEVITASQTWGTVSLFASFRVKTNQTQQEMNQNDQIRANSDSSPAGGAVKNATAISMAIR